MSDHQGFNSFLTPPGSHPKSLAHNWELHKSTIKKFYFDHGTSLNDVMKIMEMEHNFKAS
jgi:Clr5 domain